MKNQRSLCIKMYCSDDVSSFPSCSSHIVDGQPLEDSNEDNDKTKNFVRIVSGHQLNRFAAQRSQLVISGQTRSYTGVTPIPNHQTEINSRGDSYVGLNSSQHSQIKTLECYQQQPERQHERKRKLYFTEKIESEPNREVKPPKFRSYKTLDIRIKSFIGFESNCVLPVEMFARSGFFYKGFADIVACFQCGFVHRKWQHGDDPIKIHMHMNPDCYHITELRNKGILSCDNFIDESEIEYDMKDPEPTTRIKVSKLPDYVTEDVIRYFFENRRVSGGGIVDAVDYDKTTHTAVVIFEEADDVQRVIDKGPHSFDNKAITVERQYIEEETNYRGYDKCTIEVTGMNQATTPFHITLYFESRKGADSDVMSTDYVEEEEMYLVKFDSEEVVDAVIQKSHVLDGSELNVRKHIPPLAEATYRKQVFVSGFSIKTSEEAFRNYLEARCRIDVDKIIYGDIESTVIVIFKEQPDIDKLKVDCKKRNLDGQYLKIDSVPVSKCVIVSGIKESTSKDIVHYYFDNKRKSGVDGVEDVDLDAINRTCIVHFVDCEAPVEACKRKHSIEGCTVKVEIYHECLGGTTSGDGQKFKPLDPIELDLDVRKINFLTKSEIGKGIIERQLKTCYAEVLKWPLTKRRTIKIKCTLTADVKDCRKMVKTWETDVKKCLEGYL